MKWIALIFTLLTGQMAWSQKDIGAQLYTFRKQLASDLPGTLKKIREMGITKLEGEGGYGVPVPQFRELLKANQLRLISVGADFEKLQHDIPGIIAYARSFGAKYVVCFGIPRSAGRLGIKDAQNAIEVFNHAGKVLHDNGLSFCYHPHGFEFDPFEGGTVFDYMVRLLNPDWANFEMDIFWFKQAGQDPLAYLKKYPRRFPLMHLKDRKPGSPYSYNGEADEETNVVLGKGDVGITAIMSVARQYGVKEYFIEDESSRCMTQVPESLAFLRSLPKK